MTMKVEQLAALAKKRRAVRSEHFHNFHEFAEGYESDFVSPVTKSAGNVDSDILVFLQDSSSKDEMDKEFDPETASLGYTPSTSTFTNLIPLLRTYFDKELSEVYATNLFPFIKRGHMSSRIAPKLMLDAATDYGVPQIKILSPRLVIVLGVTSFDAISVALGRPYTPSLKVALDSPFDFGTTRIWCQSHPAWRGKHHGGMSQVHAKWQTMADWYLSLAPSAAA